jgi:hypothetical protein
METKIWEITYSKEDVENYFGKPITEGEWNIVVDELYNNDGLYEEVNKYVMEIVGNALNE